MGGYVERDWWLSPEGWVAQSRGMGGKVRGMFGLVERDGSKSWTDGWLSQRDGLS
jgi:hypothetical protein